MTQIVQFFAQLARDAANVFYGFIQHNVPTVCYCSVQEFLIDGPTFSLGHLIPDIRRNVKPLSADLVSDLQIIWVLPDHGCNFVTCMSFRHRKTRGLERLLDTSGCA